MATLEALTGLQTDITIGGKTYTLRPLTPPDFAVIQQRILARRGDPVAIAKQLTADMPPEIAERYLTRAYEDALQAKQVTAKELDDWRITIEGVQCQFWLQLRKAHPDITEQQAGDLLDQLGREWLQRATETLLQQFPEATPDDVLAVAMEQNETAIAELIAAAARLPEGNSSPPADEPGTPTETSLSTGADGTPS